MKRIPILSLWLLWTSLLLGRFVGEDIEQPKIGNFVLPASQAPGPLIAFGQTVVDVGDFYLFAYPSTLRGAQQKVDTLLLYPSWTPIKHFAVTVNFPITIKSTVDGVHAAGFDDMSLEFEYLYHFVGTEKSWMSSTLFSSLILPTGTKELTLGSPAYFMGLTFSYVTADWYTFASGGVTLTTTHHKTQYGNNVLYQGGLGHNLHLPFERWIFLGLIEVDGIASQSDIIKGIEDKNSGGNTISITPSLFISNMFTIMQFGVTIPLLQHLRGNQNKVSYILNANFGFTF